MKRLHHIAILISAAALALCTADASAMYNARIGRFMQRDSLGTPPEAPMARNLSNARFMQRDQVTTSHPSQSQYADGMNIYQYVGSNPVIFVDPLGKKRHVFAFEGLGGFNGMSPANVKLYWYPLAQEYGKAHYYAQDDVSTAIADAMAIAKVKGTPDKNGNCYDTIVVLGWSNGGRAAIQFAEQMKSRNIKVDLGFTADPVPKGLELTPPLIFLPNVFLQKPANTAAWINYYQQTDEHSLLGAGVVGHPVGGADNRELDDLGKYAHMQIVGDLRVRIRLWQQLNLVPEKRTDWKYK